MRLNWAIIGLLFAFASIIQAKTGSEYWNELQKVSDRKYGGFNGEIAVQVSVDESLESSGKMTLRVPIYSKKDKTEREGKKLDFLKEGAGYIEELKNCDDSVNSLEKQIKLIKAVMTEEGTSGIKDYYDTEIKINSAKNKRAAIVKVLEVMVK